MEEAHCVDGDDQGEAAAANGAEGEGSHVPGASAIERGKGGEEEGEDNEAMVHGRRTVTAFRARVGGRWSGGWGGRQEEGEEVGAQLK